MYCLKNILFSPANFFFFCHDLFLFPWEILLRCRNVFLLPPPFFFFFFFCNKNFTFSTEITLLLQGFFFLLWRASFLPQIYIFLPWPFFFCLQLFLSLWPFFFLFFVASFFCRDIFLICCKIFLLPQAFFFFFCCKCFSFITSFFLLLRAFFFAESFFVIINPSSNEATTQLQKKYDKSLMFSKSNQSY